VDDSDEKYIMTAEHNFNRQAQQLNEHFKKLLEAGCLNHAYLIKHKLKEFTMMKTFMTSGAVPMGKKPEGDPRGGGGLRTLPRGEGGHVDLRWTQPL
jgi:hypothetical protein